MLSPAGAPNGLPTPTSDSTKKTEPNNESLPAKSVLHEGIRLLGRAKSSTGSNGSTEGCYATAAEDTADMGESTEHTTRDSKV